MIVVLFLGVIAIVIYLLYRFRRAPTIYWLTAALVVLSLIENQYAANSCEGGCDIRVDLLLVLPVLAVALVLSAVAFFKSKTH